MFQIETLIEKLGSPEWHIRKDAIRSLLSLPETHYISIIEASLKDHSNANLRNGSMELLRNLGPRAVPYLIRLLTDVDSEVRLFAANLLGDIKDKGAVRHLCNALRDPDVNVRMASAEALGKIGSPDAIDSLMAATQDESWVAIAAINALGLIGTHRALDMLYKCLQSTPYAEITLEAIEQAGDSDSIKVLTQFLESGRFQELTLKSIIGIALKHRVKPMPGYFINLIPMLLELQGSNRPELRKAAVIALSWSEDKRAIQCLVDALGDEDLEEYAVAGLLAIGKIAVPSITAALKDDSKRGRPLMAKLISMLGEPMALMQFADDDDPEVRVEAALALGKVPLQRAVSLLSKMLEDPEDEVRAAAHRAIENLNQVI